MDGISVSMVLAAAAASVVVLSALAGALCSWCEGDCTDEGFRTDTERLVGGRNNSTRSEPGPAGVGQRPTVVTEREVADSWERIRQNNIARGRYVRSHGATREPRNNLSVANRIPVEAEVAENDTSWSDYGNFKPVIKNSAVRTEGSASARNLRNTNVEGTKANVPSTSRHARSSVRFEPTVSTCSSSFSDSEPSPITAFLASWMAKKPSKNATPPKVKTKNFKPPKQRKPRLRSHGTALSNKRSRPWTELPAVTVATDATPDRVGGYCIRLDTGHCQYYSFPSHQLPECLTVLRHYNSAEFEMNNLAFALFLWQPWIVKVGRLRVYTDNNAVNLWGIRPQFGQTVRAYLLHLESCLGVRIVNKHRYHVNRKRNPADFHKFIDPCDHLSRSRIVEFHEKIQSSFPEVKRIEICRPEVASAKVQKEWERYRSCLVHANGSNSWDKDGI